MLSVEVPVQALSASFIFLGYSGRQLVQNRPREKQSVQPVLQEADINAEEGFECVGRCLRYGGNCSP